MCSLPEMPSYCLRHYLSSLPFWMSNPHLSSIIFSGRLSRRLSAAFEQAAWLHDSVMNCTVTAVNVVFFSWFGWSLGQGFRRKRALLQVVHRAHYWCLHTCCILGISVYMKMSPTGTVVAFQFLKRLSKSVHFHCVHSYLIQIDECHCSGESLCLS